MLMLGKLIIKDKVQKYKPEIDMRCQLCGHKQEDQSINFLAVHFRVRQHIFHGLQVNVHVGG